ncbi:bifunctional (p)ppGpp synthetase/guanosine-3',5'-bis(diphosphate) 3'-pyrophosphohydrolase [Pelagibius litoralis]|uniref:GTP pyrophosphokinase rsh n=1 Tax=Pelagibius litoralis TaxID=374515 RepID=A0A967EUX8_9PROT|nr:bifunctional (p)ppGpp synthetase/guanosine-3',5'-bis(diphosphate) 3'-pyrophosphohydrolase [Pelagibius litoralis]NIA66994.1 bifunctional (p)ppGpp synthetase/guanosine-3',5'-bis(diphosphate) 3'-pyrophosphohydrolase [Pelagibius litoralis]
MIRQFELVERVKSYDPGADEDALNRAYVYAMKAHGAQTRASGDPYFSHPIEVAGILTELKLDDSSIITALLHDVVEDTDASLEDLEAKFGAEIARLVDGVTKLGRLELQSEETKHAENFRKLLVAMSEDIRVLLVKLADRLHNMRTLHFIGSEEKRRRIARETMDIYAPLAERIGMHGFKDQLEDLAFAELNRDGRESVLARLDFLRGQGQDLSDRIIGELCETLSAEGIEVSVSGRMKSPYSVWRKMQRKNITFEQLSDIMAFRIVVDNTGDCYHALGLLHSHYPVVPGRFKDYISTPKPNGYSSLHTTIIGPERHRIEVQIRTHQMHEIAEYGVAAHWQYKQDSPQVEGRQYRWMRELLDILEHADNPEEFLEHTKLEMFQDQVFCFTPKGAVIALPSGATPVDFAYAVHSEVGDTCVGSKVNGRMVQLRAPLQNGDQVEIITSRAQTPSPDWEQFVVSGKAKARVRRFVRLKQLEQYTELGRQILQKSFRQEGYDFSEKGLASVLKRFKSESLGELFAAVGQGHLTGREVVMAVFPGARDDAAAPKVVPLARARARHGKGRETSVPIKGLIPGMAVHYAHCCHPLPGDRIVGIVTTGKGVTVHTIDCDTLESFHATPERWVDLSWDVDDGVEQRIGRLHVIVANEPGSLGGLSTIIGKSGGNINNLKITNRSVDFFEILIDVEVGNVKHLTNIIAALRAMPVITSVERARG